MFCKIFVQLYYFGSVNIGCEGMRLIFSPSVINGAFFVDTEVYWLFNWSVRGRRNAGISLFFGFAAQHYFKETLILFIINISSTLIILILCNQKTKASPTLLIRISNSTT